MKFKIITIIILLEFTLSMTAQAGITIKGNNGSVETVRGPLLGLQAKATLLGFAKNEYDLGMAYYEGKIVERDPQKAAEWLLKASKKDYAPAMFTIGIMLLNGDGVQQNIKIGSELIQIAANKGNKNALEFIDKSKQVNLSNQINNDISKKSNSNNGMCSYQDYYIQSVGDMDYAKKNNLVVKDTEEYVKGPCQINIVYNKNNSVEIHTNFHVNSKNYNAYIVTKLKTPCEDGKCGISINSTSKNSLIEYDKIVQYDNKGNELVSALDDYENYLKEKIKQNQSYCFQARWAHSGTVFCINLGGDYVYQNERVL